MSGITADQDAYVAVSDNDDCPSTLVDKVVAGLGITLDELNDGGNETLAIINNSGNFGTEFQFAEDEAEESTTSTTFVEKLKLTTSSVPAGDYVFYWYYEAKTDSGSTKRMNVRVQLNDSSVLSENVIVDTRAEWAQFSGFDFVALATGVHTLDIDFKKNSGAANIRRARLIGWRIS